MEKTEIRERLNGIFKDVFDDESLEIRAEMSASDIEDWDSLAQIDIVTASEAAFGLKFSLAEIVTLKNIGDMLDLIDRKINA